MTVTTAEDAPNHKTIGQTFRYWNGELYFCDSHDSRQGFWMTNVESPRKHGQNEISEWRRNVSGQTLGQFYKLVGPHLAFTSPPAVVPSPMDKPPTELEVLLRENKRLLSMAGDVSRGRDAIQTLERLAALVRGMGFTNGPQESNGQLIGRALRQVAPWMPGQE